MTNSPSAKHYESFTHVLSGIDVTRVDLQSFLKIFNSSCIALIVGISVKLKQNLYKNYPMYNYIISNFVFISTKNEH